MIGSKSKVNKIFESLSKKGINTKDTRIYAPIGLHIGDKSPQEISLSILSEILKIKSSGTGKHHRDLL